MERLVFSGAAIAALFLAATSVVAQEESGRQEYMIACAGCHGESARGDGPLASLLNIHTPNLTMLSENVGNGEFPFEYTLWMIDGRRIIRAHGSEMPVWGDRYQASSTSERGESDDMIVRGRILSLVYYLESIQE
ncbi:c-type cytochrome [Nioella aestuarii]|uniref:c-type cytochrome n=1 Tax=Nioella aestuarii TaxID=1662864 RepID=UPI003D7F4E66